jgi:hypothetical protein
MIMAGEIKKENKSQSCWGGCWTAFFGKNCPPLHLAVQKNDLETVTELLKSDKRETLINKDYAGYTALATGLIRAEPKQNPAIIILLLENGADPQSTYDLTEVGGGKGTIIQHTVDFDNISNCKLLALYGASPAGLIFERQPDRKNIIEGGFANFQQRQKLAADLAKPTLTPDETTKIYQELAQLWESQIEGEKNPIYGAHYQKNANHYRTKSAELGQDQQKAPHYER